MHRSPIVRLSWCALGAAAGIAVAWLDRSPPSTFWGGWGDQERPLPPRRDEPPRG
ncbi:MAG TPA: hypothetical protein VFI16_12515 [Anaeromyxobacteraceae bacterium]|nr:hypothetical protein [Anaeromyxobacteraceae bacterium]